jgi:hypothetical protein
VKRYSVEPAALRGTLFSDPDASAAVPGVPPVRSDDITPASRQEDTIMSNLAEVLVEPAVEHLPLPLLLTSPEPVDFSPLEDLEREIAAKAASYNPVSQLGGYDIRMSSSKSPGICCVTTLGIDISSRDTVSDD